MHVAMLLVSAAKLLRTSLDLLAAPAQDRYWHFLFCHIFVNVQDPMSLL